MSQSGAGLPWILKAMAAIDASGTRNYHGTCVAGQNDVVTFGLNVRAFTVRNRSATAADVIYVRTDGVAAVSAGAGTVVVMPGTVETVMNTSIVSSTSPLAVQIISAGTPGYSIIT